ncbi:MAG: hypothetical protein JXR76_25535 [Deltaproteobacteria bacterium]|nr:hypothetical protein [Deltaproteobacteria bacterium]
MIRHALHYLFIVWLTLFSVIACGPGLIEEEAAPDSDNSFTQPKEPELQNLHWDSPPDTGSNTEQCPGAIQADCPSGVTNLLRYPDYVVASTEWLDRPARFTHALFGIVLGEFTDNETAAPFAIQVSMSNAWERTSFGKDTIIFTPPAELSFFGQWIGGAEYQGFIAGTPYPVVAVYHQNNDYFVFGIPTNTANDSYETMTPISHATLNTDKAYSRVVYLADLTTKQNFAEELNALCLYGEGMICFDGETWTEEISPDDGPEITAVALSKPLDEISIIAVDHSKTIFTRKQGAWTTHVLDGKGTVETATVNPVSQQFALAGDGLLARGYSPYYLEQCDVDLDIVDIHYFYPVSQFTVLTKEGEIFGGTSSLKDHPQLCGPIFANPNTLDIFTGQGNLFVLNESELLTSQIEQIIVE